MNTFIRKISSRKLWAAIIGVIIGLSTAFGIEEGEYTQIAGIVTSAVSVVAYIVGESQTDIARAKSKVTIIDASDIGDEIDIDTEES